MLARACVLLAAGFLALPPSAPVAAQALDIPIIEHSDGSDLDTCALGEVAGLKEDGDGFLSVRSGPASSHEKLDELHNGDRVFAYDRNGHWIGIVYDVDFVDCGPIDEDRPVETGKGKRGWVHENWIRGLAG